LAILLGPTLVGWIGAGGCGKDDVAYDKHVIVLGLDGVDHGLCKTLLVEGRLPNLARLARKGTFSRLETSTPPQSPVAWSNMMTGADPGQHGVFDFIHRHPREGWLLSSAAETVPPKPLPILGNHLDEVPLFGYRLPVRPTRIKANRHVPAFWEYLTEAGVPTFIYRMPANYPPTPAAGAPFRCLSDMGTVDLLDTLGSFSYYTEDPADRGRRITRGGGELYNIALIEHRAEATFVGPLNEYKVIEAQASGGEATEPERVRVPFEIARDPLSAVAVIRFQGHELVLKEGEWSEWQPIEFEMIPQVVTLKGICRFYLQQVHPYLKLYVSPFNFDPQEESWEIDQPSDFSVAVSDAVGRYYTQGLPEDTKALSNHVLSREEFLQQAEIVLQERLRLLEFAMDRYKGGMMFFYFGSPDQIGHMFWGLRWEGHPAATAEEHRQYRNLMQELYVRMDGIVGRVMERFPDATIIVMSDHGFCDYRRRFSLNTWLKVNGYAAMRVPSDPKLAANIDGTRSRAYGIGFNGLYINLRGRERFGIVEPARKQALMDEITSKLKAYRDPATGQQVVLDVYQCDKLFSGPMLSAGPDMIVGYAPGYRGGGASAIAAFPEAVVEDNDDPWISDHCVAPEVVPGVLFTNRDVSVPDPSLLDLAPTILHAFDVTPPAHMKGRDLFGASPDMMTQAKRSWPAGR
jgi:predicted AlkP superfamily phosphohydrolase/phosphomutase